MGLPAIVDPILARNVMEIADGNFGGLGLQPQPGCSSSVMSDAPPAFSHDVFISYSHRDRDLVVGEVLRPLRAAQLRVVIDRDDFPFGAVAAKTMEEAVKNSCHTLAVVTENYCKSAWSGFELQLTTLLDPSGSSNRLIPLLFDKVELPLSLQRLTYADFTRPEERGPMMARLLQQIGLSRQAVLHHTAVSATRGIESLRHFLTTPEVRDLVERFEHEFAQAAAQTKLLGGYKGLHDELQKAQLGYRIAADRKKELLRAVEADDTDESDRDKLSEAFNNACEDLYPLLHDVLRKAHEVFAGDEPLWIDDLKLGESDLSDGITSSSFDRVNEGMRLILRVLGREPAALNRRLVEEAERLDFTRVLAPLREILRTLNALNFSNEAAERLEDFAGGLASIDRLQQTLRGLVRNHDSLHAMDDQLAQFDEGMPEPGRIRSEFRLLEKRRARLLEAVSGTWKETMREAAAKLQEVLDTESSAPDGAQWARTVRQRFRKFRSQVTEAFHQTDHDLNSLCGQLGEFGRGVTDTLREMNR
jgi:TIR domain